MHNHCPGNLHIAIHAKLHKFDPRSTTNPLMLDYINDCGRNLNRIIDIASSDISSVGSELIPAIPIGFRSILNDNTLLWCGLIERIVFEEKLFNLFYSEYSEILDKIVNANVNDGDSIIYRDYVSGCSIFHTAAKFRILSRVRKDSGKSIGRKISGIDEELTYIIKCYKDLGKVFRAGNELTIAYIEDFSGVYLTDYITNYVDELINSSMF